MKPEERLKALQYNKQRNYNKLNNEIIKKIFTLITGDGITTL